jgi:hypothetical protein
MRKTLFVLALVATSVLGAYAANRSATPGFEFRPDCPTPPCPPIAAAK